MAMWATAEFVQRRWDEGLMQVAARAILAARERTDVAFGQLTGLPTSAEGMHDALSPEGTQHADLLANYWNDTLKDKLAPFSYEWGPKSGIADAPPAPPI
jgi:hypothetical protein